ncbi:MAG: class I SAM-dependent methyltransferase [Pseudomonadota bacterium]
MTARDALYRDPRLVALYDTLNSARADEAFYRARLPAPPARLLDVGCGTGRFARDCAAAGYTVTACDPAAQMVEHAARGPGAGAVRWHVGTADTLPIDAPFDAAVMMGHAFQCLLEDADITALFTAIVARLAPGGSFWFETRNPAARPWQRWTPDHAAPPRLRPGGGTVQVVHEVLSRDGALLTYAETYRLDGAPDLRSVSTLRFAEAAEIEALAASAGLSTAARFGTWTGAPFDPGSSPEIIFHLKRAA